MSAMHDHDMICTHCGMRATLASDTPCEADPFPFNGYGGRVYELCLSQSSTGRLFIESAECDSWTDTGAKGAVGVDARPVAKEDVLVNGAPRPGWYTIPLDWTYRKGGAGRGYPGWEGCDLLAVARVNPDGSVTTKTGEEWNAEVDARIAACDAAKECGE